MPDVFISYKREDHVRVDRLAGILRDLGADVWHDAALSAGLAWQDRIEGIARAARAIVVCWTDAAAGSSWIQSESKIGLGRGVLVPAKFAPCEVPAELQALHFADLSDWTDGCDHKGLLQLVGGIDVLLRTKMAAKLIERGGGENPEVVSRLRALLVKVARSGADPIPYDRAFASVAAGWADGSKASFSALYGALDAIAEQNRSRREPPLFALVVKNDGVPGKGYFEKHCFIKGADTVAARELHQMHLRRVYAYSWPNDP